MKKKLTWLVAAALLVVGLASCSNTQTTPNSGAGSGDNSGGNTSAEASYPTRSINFIVPYGAGGGTDVMGRAVVGNLDLPVTTYVTNIEGASAGTGSMEAYYSDPDGYTVLVHQAEALVTYVTTGTYSAPLDEELEPIATVAWDPQAISVAANGKFKSLEDIVSYAKEHPGEIKWAAMGTNSSNHLTSALIWEAAGIEVTYVPYDSASKSKTAVLGGNADVLVGQVSEVKALVDSGEMICVAVTSEKRSSIENFTEVPTAVELGYDVIMGNHRGFFAPPGTPESVVEYLAEKIKEVYSSATFEPTMADLGYESEYLDAQQIKDLIEKTKPDVQNAMEVLKG